MKRSRILDHQNEPGIFIYDTGIELDNCVVANNLKGGLETVGVAFRPTLINKTVFAENGNLDGGNEQLYGAIHYRFAGGNLQISNSVFYNNVSQSVGSDIDPQPLFGTIILEIISDNNSVFASTIIPYKYLTGPDNTVPSSLYGANYF